MISVSKVRKMLTLDTPAKRTKFESYIQQEMKLVVRSALNRWKLRSLAVPFKEWQALNIN